MAIAEVDSNGDDYGDNLSSDKKRVSLRKYNSDEPLTWDEHDNNFEVLRAKLNEVIRALNQLDNG